MKTIGIVTNTSRDIDLKVTKMVINWLQLERFNVKIPTEVAQIGGLENLASDEIYVECDLIIAIGGDGTILSVAQQSILSQVPILGLNLGRLGFLADIETTDIQKYLTQERLTMATTEERMMIEINVTHNGQNVGKFHALNELSIIRVYDSRITEIETSINKKVYDIYPADGILVATPTGSTGYNLSAGGPILVPYARNIILTPICPHTIFSRTMILTDQDLIGIKIAGEEELSLCIDGESKMIISNEHNVEVRASEEVVRLLKVSDMDFFDILTKKIVERGR